MSAWKRLVISAIAVFAHWPTSVGSALPAATSPDPAPAFPVGKRDVRAEHLEALDRRDLRLKDAVLVAAACAAGGKPLARCAAHRRPSARAPRLVIAKRRQPIELRQLFIAADGNLVGGFGFGAIEGGGGREGGGGGEEKAQGDEE